MNPPYTTPDTPLFISDVQNGEEQSWLKVYPSRVEGKNINTTFLWGITWLEFLDQVGYSMVDLFCQL